MACHPFAVGSNRASPEIVNPPAAAETPEWPVSYAPVPENAATPASATA
jgi:hypothetical protein